MNKKIIAVFCVVILMVSVFSACGNKGYLLMKDENGVEHAYVTDENGSTVLNEQGEIRVYQTEKNGEIAKDENGKPKENSIQKPSFVAADDKYETDDFVLSITDEWKNATNISVKYIKGKNTECYIQISQAMDDFENTENELAERLKGEIELNESLFGVSKNGVTPSFEHGYKEICGMNMYTYEYYIEVEGKPSYYSSTFYFAIGKNVYCISYTDNDGKEYSPDFDFSSYLEKNLTVKTK